MELVCKNLKTDFDSYKAFVDFYFKCTSCKVCSTVSGASREDRIPWQCPECRGRLNTESKRLKNKIKTVDACSKCSYKDVTEIDLTTTERKPTKKEQTKFIEDKARFCLTDFEGQKYLEGKRSLNAVTELMKIMESEPKQEPKIRVLSIKQVQDLIRKILKKKKFENISFSVPEIRRDIIFTMKAIDSESRSWATVKKLLIDEIKKELKETNWNLMNEGINSKLGLIEARFRGREVHQEREYALDNVIL